MHKDHFENPGDDECFTYTIRINRLSEKLDEVTKEKDTLLDLLDKRFETDYDPPPQRHFASFGVTYSFRLNHFLVYGTKFDPVSKWR